MELFPYSLSLSHSLLGPASFPCHLSRILPHLFFCFFFFFPQHLLHPRLHHLKPELGSSLPHCSFISSDLSLSRLISCWGNQLENTKRFFCDCHSGPPLTQHVGLRRFGICGGRQPKGSDWQLWSTSHSEFRLNVNSFCDTSAVLMTNLCRSWR